MERGDWVLAATLLSIPTGLTIMAVAFAIPHDWLQPLGVMSGWISAIGVFVAVIISGAQNRRQSERTRSCDYIDLVKSTNTITQRAMVAANWIHTALNNGASDPHGRNPTRTLEEAHKALDAIHVHELKDSLLITVAMLVKTDVAELMDFTNPPRPWSERQTAGVFADIDLRDAETIKAEREAFIACLIRTIADCQRFMAIVGRVLSENGVNTI